MKLSRRQFIGLAAGLSLGGCKRLGVDKASLERLTPDISMPSVGKERRFTFAAVNDLHLVDARSTAIVKRAVQQINQHPGVHFTVALGDLGTDGTLQEMRLAKQCLDGLSRPYFTIPGNHDVAMARENIYGNFEDAFGDTQWERSQGTQWAFIGLDTCNETASDVTIPEERMAWLERRLKRIGRSQPVALFTHHPLNPNTQAYRVQNAEEVLGLFANNNLKLVASGHYHGNQIEERDGVLFTTTACCSSTRGNHDGTEPRGYRLFHVDRETITHEFVEVPL